MGKLAQDWARNLHNIDVVERMGGQRDKARSELVAAASFKRLDQAFVGKSMQKAHQGRTVDGERAGARTGILATVSISDVLQDCNCPVNWRDGIAEIGRLGHEIEALSTKVGQY